MEKTPEEMSMDELQQLVLQNWDASEQQPTAQPVVAAQPAAAKKADAQPVEEAEEVVYQRKIDLGDGSGVQVFEAPTMEELIDKLAVAQEHATRKIREQAAQLKEKEKPVAEPEMTPEQKWLWEQKLKADPSSLIREEARKMFEQEYGPQIKELNEEKQARQGTQTALDWMAVNPDYYACDKNGQRMEKWLSLNQLAATPENLTAAFQDLSESGLLVPKPTETPAGTEAVKEEATRIAEPTPVTTTVRRKVVGEVSTKRQAPVEKTAPGLTEAELYKMPMADLEQIMYRDFQ